jgi:hypothetical protein
MRRRAHGLLTNPLVRAVVLLGAVLVSVWSVQRVPGASWLPALVGLAPWVVGKYVLCPLRWHALSTSGQGRAWHLRRYAESELLGLASPGHAGADLWRIHTLEKTGMRRACAVTEVGLDRLVGALGLTLFVLVAGASLPPQVLAAALGGAAALTGAALVVRRARPGLLRARPMPPPRVVARGVLLSMGYQLTIVGLLVGTVAAMGQQVHPVALLGVFGASQVAGIVPGVHGASPREGALVVGLASLGISWSAALGAVALTALLAWVPAVLLGGASLAVGRWQRLRAAAGPAGAAATA